MKILITILFILSSFLQLLGQSTGGDIKYQFAKDVFKTDYKKKDVARFNGKIERIDENTIRFGDKVVTLYLEDKSLTNIFLYGIFYPNIVGGTLTTKVLTKAELDTMSTLKKVIYNLSRTDIMTIGNIEGLEKLNPDGQTRRYKFWLYSPGSSNPTECYFELYNGQGTKEMRNEDFIENSKLTFYHRGTLIL